MIVSCIQTAPRLGAPEVNLDRVEEAVLGADADLVVLPELFASGYFFESTDQARALAEAVPDGPTTRRLHDWARQSGATLVAGLPERDGDRLYNSAVVVEGFPDHVPACHFYTAQHTDQRQVRVLAESARVYDPPH